MHPVTWPRLATALVTASTAILAFIRSEMEYPTIRRENTGQINWTQNRGQASGASVTTKSEAQGSNRTR